MKCAECEEPIDTTEHYSYYVVFSDQRVESHCSHNPVDENDPTIVAFFGSRHCLVHFLMREQEMLDTPASGNGLN